MRIFTVAIAAALIFVFFIRPINSQFNDYANEHQSRIKAKQREQIMIPDVKEPISMSDQITSYIDGTDVTLDDVIWLARCAYSETKDDREAYHIMWIVRNRVLTQHRGKVSYRSVVLDPYQFSAFNPTNNERKAKLKRTYMNMGVHTKSTTFRKYLILAAQVATAPESENPYMTKRVLHFVHENALKRVPKWLPDSPDWKVNELSIYRAENVD